MWEIKVKHKTKQNTLVNEFRRRFTKDYLNEIKKTLDLLEDALVQTVDKFADILLQAREQKKTIFIMGNGGSASTASHFASDLSRCAIKDNCLRFKVIALTDNVSGMLAWANDKNYESIFIEQLKNFIERGDVVIGISGSGNSANIINAIEYANNVGAITIGLSGYDGGKLKRCAKENIHVPSFCMQHVEDIHLLIEHLLTSMIREDKRF